MTEITEINKKKLLEFIKENELDYTPVDNGINRFHIISHDGIKFFFYDYNNECVVVKYDSNKDKGDNPASMAYSYFNFQNFTQVLEQISFYDKSLNKVYWTTIADCIEQGFRSTGYNENWYQEFTTDDNWITEDYGTYKVITYSNSNYKPELKSPYNTLHEVSPINKLEYTKVDKLYFEIHPVSCLEGKETYLFKLSINNEEVFKEYINYVVSSKKGLKLLIKELFTEMEKFKI